MIFWNSNWIEYERNNTHFSTAIIGDSDEIYTFEVNYVDNNINKMYSDGIWEFFWYLMKTIKSQVKKTNKFRSYKRWPGSDEKRKHFMLFNSSVLLQLDNLSFYIHIYDGSKPVRIIVLNWCRNFKLMNLCRCSHFIAPLEIISREHILWEYQFNLRTILLSQWVEFKCFFHRNTMYLNTDILFWSNYKF